MVDSLPDSGHARVLASAADLTALWEQFRLQFPTEDSCVEEFYRRAGEELLRCRYCSKPVVQRKPGARVIECSSCRRNTWPMAGTFFQRMRCPRAWLAVFWFYEHGVAINGWKLHELSGIAPSSAFNLLKKFTTVMRELLPQDATVVSSEMFCSVFGKRSRETPAGKHPRAEQYEFPAISQVGEQARGAGAAEAVSSALPKSDSSPPVNVDSSGSVDVASTISELEIQNDNERKVYSLLSDEPMHFDILCSQTNLPAGSLSAALTMLELAGRVERLIGDYFLRKGRKQSGAGIQAANIASVSEQAVAKVSKILGFISATPGGISRKYLQNYIGVFCFLMDVVGCRAVSLFAACLRFGPMAHKQTTDYVTPAVVSIGTA